MTGEEHDEPYEVGTEAGEREPDYRFTLANERTFLAWMRTAVALLAAGVAARELLEPFEVRHARTGLAVVAVGLSLGLAVASYVRWARVQQAMRRGQPLPRSLAVPVLATVVAASAGVSVLLVLLA